MILIYLFILLLLYNSYCLALIRTMKIHLKLELSLLFLVVAYFHTNYFFFLFSVKFTC